MDYEIHIENGKKNKCPHCGAIFSIENEFEILFRNITLLHRVKKSGEQQAKCKQCKSMIKIA
jgi:DNA-directed RNA polymerase subunit RPC12/RpoP